MAAKTVALVIDLQIKDGGKTQVTVNNLAELKKVIKDTQAQFATTDFGTAQYNKLDSTLKVLKNTYRVLGKEGSDSASALADAQRQLNGEASKSPGYYRQLQTELTGLKNKLKDLSKEELFGGQGGKIIGNIQRIDAELKSLDARTGVYARNVGNYKSAMLGTLDLVTAGVATGGIAAALQLVNDTVVSGVTAFADYEKALDNLSALTGVTGNDLLKFKDKAASLTEIDVNGQRVVNSATDVLEAFKLVGGAQPELLKSADALAGVTKEAIVLSGASGDTLPNSITALTTSLAQFNLPASQSNEIINQLAAGAKEGASEIPDTTEALRRFGATASASNISIGESISLIEILADKQLKGAEAGTQLRSIIAKISDEKIITPEAAKLLNEAGVNIQTLTDKTLPLGERMKELGKLNGNTAALTKLFGLENVTAAQILAQSGTAVTDFTAKISGTNEAYKQAGINAGNLKTEYENLKNEGINTLTDGLETLTPVLSGVIAIMSKGIGVVGGLFNFLKQLPQFIEENKLAFSGLGAGLVILNGQMILASANSIRLAAVERIRTAITAATIIAQNGLNAAMSANPIGLIITAVSALVIGFKALYNKSETVRASISGLGSLASEVFTIVKESVKAFITGFNDLKAGNFSDALSHFGEAIVKSNPISLAFSQGERLKNAFTKGYSDKLAEGVQAATADATGDITLTTTTTTDKTPKPPKPPGGDKKEQADGIKAIREEIQRLNDALENTSDDNKIAKILAEISSKTDKLEELQAKIEKIRQSLTDDPIASDFDPIGNKAAELEAITKLKVKSETADVERAQENAKLIRKLGDDATEAERNRRQKEKEEQDKADKDAAESRKKQYEDLLNEATGLAEQITSGLVDIEKQRLERQRDNALTALDAEYQAKIKAAGGNSQLEEKLKTELESKKLAIEKDAAKKRKAIAVKEALIAGALAFVKALPNLFAAGAALVSAGIQVAFIKAQEFAFGGKVKRLRPGIITEKPNITPTPNGDSVVAFVGPGEALLTKNQQTKVERDTGDPQYFDKLFNGGASQRRSRGYDLAVPAFASGGVVSSQTIVATLSDEDRALLNKVFTSIEQSPKKIAGAVGPAVENGITTASKEANRINKFNQKTNNQ